MRKQRMNDDDLNAIGARLELDPVLSAWVDPVTGYTIPAISGSQDGVGDGGGDGSGDGDDGGDGGDGDGDNSGDSDEIRARLTEAERKGEKAGRRKALRELGFGTMNDGKAFVAANANKGSGDSSGGDGSAQPPPPPAPAPNVGLDPADVLRDVTIAVASSGVSPAKIESAAALVVARLDLEDHPDATDIAAEIAGLRKSEPGWFPTSDKPGDQQSNGSGSGPKPVPGPGRGKPPTPGSNVDAALARQKARMGIKD